MKGNPIQMEKVKINDGPRQDEIIWGKAQERHDTLSRGPRNQDQPSQDFQDNPGFTSSA